MSAEWPGRCRLAAAIGLGVFVGCLPLLGSRLWLCAGLASVFRLSRLKLYLAANISTPLLAPVIAFAEIQLGSYVQDGVVHAVSLASLAQTSPWHFSGDLLVGSFVAGTALAAFSATATWRFARSWFDPRQENLIAAAAASYLRIGIQAWRTANAKLRFDPVYREAIRRVEWPSEGRVLDLGCGRGLMLSVLARFLDGRGGATAAAAARHRLPPAHGAPGPSGARRPRDGRAGRPDDVSAAAEPRRDPVRRAALPP